MNSDFEPPPKHWSLLVTVGGVVTALVAITLLNLLSKKIHTDYLVAQQAEISKAQQRLKITPTDPIALLDEKSITQLENSVSSSELRTSDVPYTAPGVGKLSDEEMAIARHAWLYFQHNWNQDTGLVNSVDGFKSVTMWDQAAAIAALVSAKELNIIKQTEFEEKMRLMFKTLASLPLYKGELPNKVYNSQTLVPVGYGKLEQRQEIGWSAIDLGRMAIWLKIVSAKYPQLRSPAEAVWKSWNVSRLTKDGQMYGTAVVENKEQYNQEGRLGYENYSAYGLKLWGLDVKQALDYQSKAAFVNIYGQRIPYDSRNRSNSGGNNYVLSESYILDGIETGFQALPKAYADGVLAAQEARYQKTKRLTAVTEDNLDRPPYFLYNSLYVNGEPWAAITDLGQKYNQLRFVSAKAAIGWHVLYNTAYTRQLFDFVTTNLKTDGGWYNGYYESLHEPNRTLTANNNGVILQSLLYKKVGKPLTLWAGIEIPK